MRILDFQMDLHGFINENFWIFVLAFRLDGKRDDFFGGVHGGFSELRRDPVVDYLEAAVVLQGSHDLLTGCRPRGALWVVECLDCEADDREGSF